MFACFEFIQVSFQTMFTANRNIFCRVAVMYFFMLEGLLAGVFASQLPSIQDDGDLSDSALGFCVLFLYFGTVLATPIAGRITIVIGSKWSTISSALLFTCALPFVGLNPRGNFSFDKTETQALLSATMFWFGFTLGLMDVSMNACGVVAEIVDNRPLMGSFHGSYSIAAAIAALIGSSLSAAGWSPLKIFLLISVICLFTTLAAGGSLYKSSSEMKYSSLKNSSNTDLDVDLSDDEDVQRNVEKDEDNNFCCCDLFPNITTLFLCAVGFLASYGEGGMVTWCVIYYDRYLGLSGTLNSLGYITFMICMASGRFACDKLRQKFGRRKLVRMGGILSGSGLFLVVFSPLMPLSILFSTIGFALTGSGLSTLIPTVFSSAGHLPNQDAGKAIATVAAFTYSGSIVSPPMIGAMSSLFGSLRLSFLVVSFLMFILFFLSFGVPPEIENRYDVESLLTTTKIDDNNKSQPILPPVK